MSKVAQLTNRGYVLLIQIIAHTYSHIQCSLFSPCLTTDPGYSSTRSRSAFSTYAACNLSWST